jgi:hypothetical protein
MIGVYFVSKELFRDKKIALASSLLYIIYPFTFIYDRMALYDSLLATFAVWSLYMEILLIRNPKYKIALLSIPILGGALLTKSSAFLYLYMIPLSLLLFDFRGKHLKKRLLKWLLLIVIASIGAAACYSILRFSPNYHYIADKNNTFIYPFSQWVHHPFEYLINNTHVLTSQLVRYSTIPILVLVASAFLITKKFINEKLLLFGWFVFPFMSLAFFGKMLYPRYILFMTIPLIILAGFSLVTICRMVKPKYLKYLIVITTIAPMLYINYYVVSNIAKAPIPLMDHVQYIEGFDGGAGINQTVAFLREQSKTQQIYVGTQGVFGLMPDALQDYFNNDSNVIIKPFALIPSTPPQEVLDAARSKPTYFVFYAPCPLCSDVGIAPPGWYIEQQVKVTRLDGTYLTVDKIIPD